MRARLSGPRSNRIRFPSGRCSLRGRKKPFAYPRRSRAKSARSCSAQNSTNISDATRGRILDILGAAAVMFEGASIIVSSDDDLLVLDPGGAFVSCDRSTTSGCGNGEADRAQPPRSYSSGIPALRRPAK